MKIGALDAKAIDKVIASRHPGYAPAAQVWALIDDVTGATVPEFAERHLFKHRTEYDESFEYRKKRAYWHQVSLSIRVSFVNHLMKVSPTFNAASEGGNSKPAPGPCQELWQRATRDGRTFLDFMREVAEKTADKGVLWVGMDRPAADPGPSRLTEKGTEPYCYAIAPEDILDGKIEGGKMAWALVRETYRDDMHPVSSTGKVLERYRLWTDEESVALVPVLTSTAKDAKPAYQAEAPIPHPIGRVPIVFFGYGNKQPCFAAPGLLHAIAYMDREIFNLCSQYSTILNKQTFSQLAIPTDVILQDDEGGLTEEGQNVVNLGEEELFTFDPKSGQAPIWITPPAHPAETLKQGIEGLLDQCLMQACLDGEHTAQANKTGQSGGPTAGITMAYVFDKLNARLCSFAGSLGRGANDLMHMARQWMGEKVCDEDCDRDLVTMPSSFDVKSLAQDILEDLSIKTLGIPSPTFEKLQQKGVVRKRYPKLDEATLRKIDAEIEAGDPYGEHAPMGDDEGSDSKAQDDEEGASGDGQGSGDGKHGDKAKQPVGFRKA